MKKVLVLILVVLMMFSSTALAYNVSEPGVIPVVDEVVEYTIVAPDTTYVNDLNENTLTSWIAEKTNVQLVFQEIPDTEWDTKVNLLIASDELPDAFIYGGFTAAELADYGSQGVFMAMNDIIEEHGYYTKQVFEQQDKLPGAYTALDGKMYTLPDINECYHCFYSMRAWINQTWLDNLGLEYPNTLEELCEVLRAFKDQDANGNGDPNDEIPMTGDASSWNAQIYPFLLNSFLHYDTSNLSVKEDGTVIFTPIQEEFKEGIKYIASMIAEGLIEKEALTQTPEQLLTKGSGGDVSQIGVFTAATWWTAVSQDVGEGSRCREYVGLSPLEGPEGVRISPWSGTGFNMGNCVITAACEDPVPLFKMFDYMLSDEGTLRSQQGVEGVDYALPDEGVTGINGKPALYNPFPLETETELYTTHMPNVFPANRTSDFRLGEQADYSDPETQWLTEPRLYNESHDHFMPYADESMMYPSAVNLTSEESERINFLQTQINDYVEENIALFLAGEKDVDAEWDAYVAEFDNLNLDEYMELRQTAYTRQYGDAAQTAEAETTEAE